MRTTNILSKSLVLSTVFLLWTAWSCTDEKVMPAPIIAASEIFSLGSNAVTIKSELINAEKLNITAQGIYWSTSPNPTVTDKTVSGDINSNLIYCRITGLTPHTKYYAKVYATNSTGTGYSYEFSFTTNNTVTDIDGNVYNTVTIGTQVWMVEDLKTTKFNDGVEIPLLPENASIDNHPSSFYCWYENDIKYKIWYGAFYNYPAVTSGKLCPAGWHVPSDAEWTTLTDFLGGESHAGGLLKQIGTSWNVPNIGANNYSGFSSLPGGSTSVGSSFIGKNFLGIWWTSTIDENNINIYRSMFFDQNKIDRNGFQSKANTTNGLMVRCIKD